jgi:hypothetical protein
LKTLRLALGKQAAADFRQVALVGFDSLLDVFGLPLALREVLLDKLAIAQIVRDDGINIRECRRGIALYDALRCGTVLEGADDEFQ